jgi:hypothetical protein
MSLPRLQNLDATGLLTVSPRFGVWCTVAISRIAHGLWSRLVTH